ncbi:hypothetical protein PIB30_061346 [Stylosanthes scabra]|uniref:Ubiquitin-like protease family profile domain-containing protein n=1 Tax=Stylosanthes scabra TaxID=79078 RepID=A0ABU6ZJI4_9FABA|nr:hypothetical protein [Stylosanthes scabra]
MTLTFYPTLDMRIEGIDLCAAAFIFNDYLDQGEVLVRTMDRSLTQGMLRCLELGKQLHDDVMDLLGAMLTVHSSRVQWFLPSIFSIYIPIFSDGHWFLLFIDNPRRELIYLDSLASDESNAKRRWDIKKRRCFWRRWCTMMTGMITLKRFLGSLPGYVDPFLQTSSGPFYLRNNDCGMYLAQWMILYRLGGSYNVERITEYSRMRLAVDMVLKHHNDLRPKFIQDALQHLSAYVKDPPDHD